MLRCLAHPRYSEGSSANKDATAKKGPKLVKKTKEQRKAAKTRKEEVLDKEESEARRRMKAEKATLNKVYNVQVLSPLTPLHSSAVSARAPAF